MTRRDFLMIQECRHAKEAREPAHEAGEDPGIRII